MKRIKAACICQTLHFMHKEGVPQDWAINQVQQEVQPYKQLKRGRVKHRILEETTQEDGSVIIKIIKQYNASPVADYLA